MKGYLCKIKNGNDFAADKLGHPAIYFISYFQFKLPLTGQAEAYATYAAVQLM